MNTSSFLRYRSSFNNLQGCNMDKDINISIQQIIINIIHVKFELYATWPHRDQDGDFSCPGLHTVLHDKKRFCSLCIANREENGT